MVLCLQEEGLRRRDRKRRGKERGRSQQVAPSSSSRRGRNLRRHPSPHAASTVSCWKIAPVVLFYRSHLALESKELRFENKARMARKKGGGRERHVSAMEVIKQRQLPKKVSAAAAAPSHSSFFSHSAVDATEKKGGKGEAVTDVA